MLDRVREIASKIQASDKDSPVAESPQASVAPKPSTGGTRRIKGVPKELSESGDYRILKELGRGGMGVVYLAKYLPMDRPEVLKVLNSQMVKRESARKRFVTEMKAIGKLNHPSIATAYQQVPLPTQLVFSMEYVPGIDLHKFIAKYQPIPIPAA
ncbi:protein kinase domain-containing protein, partial [Rhodopirellula sallentina]